MNFSQDFIEHLYEFYMNNYEALCDDCKWQVWQDTGCSPDCPDYEEYDTPPLEREGAHSYTHNCIDLDFGCCNRLKNTPCYTCVKNNMNNFEPYF